MKIFDGISNKKKISLYISIIISFATILFSSTYGQQNAETSSADQILLTVNLQRILEQMSLVQASLSKGDSTSAFEHAYISHSIIFPSIKDKLSERDQNSTEKLESLLIDLPIMVKSNSSSQIESKIVQIVDILNTTSSNLLDLNKVDYNSVIASTIVVLLNDTSKSYDLSNIGNTKDLHNQIDYENALGMVGISNKLYKSISNLFDNSKRMETESFFRDLQDAISQKSDPQTISKLITAIQTNLNVNESNFQPDNSAIYFGNIKNLLSKVNNVIRTNSDYPSAEKYATTAYLDNFEYIEGPLEKVDPNLKNNIELMMREELRELIKNKQQSEIIVLLPNITNNLSKAANLLNVNYEKLSLNGNAENPVPIVKNSQRSNLSDIKELSKGFGTFTGVKKGFGQSSELERNGVRTDIDTIRIKLVDLLQQYKDGQFSEAFITSRSAYLDSYEGIEIPLRPINPDYTLDMEIKFAELRNMIQQHQPYAKIEGKVVEIRAGLDESE
ncbi:MAG TPA: hypothetical protein VI146_05485, partial [Nitrososphaeraceae archaeon]